MRRDRRKRVGLMTKKRTSNHNVNHFSSRKAAAALLSKTLAILVSVALITTPAYAVEVIEGVESGSATQNAWQVEPVASGSGADNAAAPAGALSGSGDVAGTSEAVSNVPAAASSQTTPTAQADAATSANEPAAAQTSESANGAVSDQSATEVAPDAKAESASATSSDAQQAELADREAAASPDAAQTQGATETPSHNEATNQVESSGQDASAQAGDSNAEGTQGATTDGASGAEAGGDTATAQAAPQKAAARTAKAASPKMTAMATPKKESGDFVVEGDEANYDFNDGVLTVHGDVTVKTVAQTAHRIQVVKDAVLTLAGVDINAANGAAIKVAAGVVAKIILAAETINAVAGGANYAGVEVGYEDGNLASLTIDGEGTLNATGGSSSAGIGGSYANKDSNGKSIASYSGDITIDGGTINAVGNGGAGIGMANNNRLNSDGTTNKSASYPMLSDKYGVVTINGGDISALGNGGAAGIGGGNHTDATVVVNGGTIRATGTGGGAGIGSGIGSQQREPDGSKGPGAYYADVTINDGTIESASEWLGAGIGGGYGADARVTINGGTIDATGGNGNSGANYQGGTGIGAGYMGLSAVTINGGTINAKGGTGSPGIGIGAGALAQKEGASFDKKKRGSDATITYDEAETVINGGNVTAVGGINAAGIGSGNGDEICRVTITGGTVNAFGYSDPDNLLAGGAGIGSGTGLNGAATKYKSDTDTYVSITGGNVVAVGGWGASGIGSGAANKQALDIVIDAVNANIEAYADGTKFAIDTRVVNADGSTSQANNTDIEGNILQGTFVHAYEKDDVTQGTEGLKDIEITNEQTGEVKTLTGMLEGYRSFAATVSDPGSFTVFTADQNVANGDGRYFARFATDEYDPAMITGHDARYEVVTGKLSDNNYLFPVKSVVVRKVIDAPEAVANQVNETFYFALWIDSIKDYLRKADGSIWVEPIKVVDGQALTTAKFIGVDDLTFGVWEVANEQGEALPDVKGNPINYGKYRLVGITTAHGDTADNDATIDKNTWTDTVSVINTFVGAEDDQPEDQGNPPVADPETEGDSGPGAEPEQGSGTEPSETTYPDIETGLGPIEPDAAGGAPVDATAGGPAPAAGGAGPVPGAAAVPVAAAANPLAGVVGAAAGIQDEANPLAEGEAIADEGNPLAGMDIDCWVHWWILLGILITAAYSAVVIVRRQKKSNDLAKMDRNAMSGERGANTGSQPATTLRPQPAMSAKVNS